MIKLKFNIKDTFQVQTRFLIKYPMLYLNMQEKRINIIFILASHIIMVGKLKL